MSSGVKKDKKYLADVILEEEHAKAIREAAEEGRGDQVSDIRLSIENREEAKNDCIDNRDMDVGLCVEQDDQGGSSDNKDRTLMTLEEKIELENMRLDYQYLEEERDGIMKKLREREEMVKVVFYNQSHCTKSFWFLKRLFRPSKTAWLNQNRNLIPFTRVSQTP